LWYNPAMRNRPLHILSLISMVIWAVSLLLVVRSFWVCDSQGIPTSYQRTYVVGVIDAQLMLFAHPEPSDSFRYQPVPVGPYRATVDRVWLDMTGSRSLGVGWKRTPGGWALILPLWLVPAVGALLPARWWLVRSRKGSRDLPVEPETVGTSQMITTKTADAE
jgi:hypothetical protein